MGATHISKEYGGRHANLALLSLETFGNVERYGVLR